ncbi:unnamed protein product [Durusdinium trenchii]|uniref:Uncharacterized protein n=1 Tax=Durusdinium trenchii TaxID=1381693 RepID=A0ABP0JPD2_9DINO
MAPKAVQTAEEAAPGRSSGSLPASQLPWAQIPSFVAGETDLDDYGKKLTFLASIWPEEHIGHLAPRAALQCDPVSFKKISRISPEELKSKNGNKTYDVNVTETPGEEDTMAETTTMAETPYEPEQDPELMDTLPEDVQDYESTSTRPTIMAMKKTMAHHSTEDELSGEEDPTLVSETRQALDYTYMIPPGMTSLKQWGQEKMSTGKHAGQSFDVLFEMDANYVNFILRHKRLTGVDMRSFQNYCMARRKKEAEASQMPVRKTKGKSSTESEWSHIDWETMEYTEYMEAHQTQGPMTKTTEKSPASSKGTPHKRALPKAKDEKPMTIEPNPQHIQALQTQIAMLQRELARHGYENQDAPPVPETP